MKRTRTLIAGVVAGLALAVAAGTYAQPTGGMGQGYGPGMGMGHGHGFQGGGDPAARAEARLADLKAQLKIAPAQEAAWQAYATQAKQQAANMQAFHAQQQAAASAPERMAQHTAAMQQRAAGMAAMTNAFGALYGVLTPEQKAIADQNVGMMGHGGKHFGRHAG